MEISFVRVRRVLRPCARPFQMSQADTNAGLLFFGWIVGFPWFTYVFGR